MKRTIIGASGFVCTRLIETLKDHLYNLLRQISGGNFLILGDGNNRKSMAYVGNIVVFTKLSMENKKKGYNGLARTLRFEFMEKHGEDEIVFLSE